MTTERLLEHITTARWFGGKGRSPRLAGLTPLPWLRPPGEWPAVRVEIAALTYPDGAAQEFYQLLLSYHPAGHPAAPEAGVIAETEDQLHGRLIGVDGTEDSAAHDALLRHLLSGSAPDIGTAVIAGHRLGHDQLHPGLPSRVFGGQQSNTSLEYAHAAILKLFRRIEPGRNRDIETHAVLTRAGCAEIDRLYGWLDGRWSGPGDSTVDADLAMLVERVTDARDGWEFALAELHQDQDFSEPAAALGAALSRLHTALRDSFPTEQTPGDRRADELTARLDASIAVVGELAPYRDRLVALFDRLRGRELDLQRIHGDFHLGQALHAPAGWRIIDFEGEPAASAEERTRPDAVWRDVAGLLRSFDYAVGHLRMNDPDRSVKAGTDWAVSARTAFLTGYGISPGDQDAAGLLSAYLADKAIYEAVYESRHRPGWLPIPLAAVAELAARPT